MSVRSLRSKVGALARRAVPPSPGERLSIDVVVVVEPVDLPRLAEALRSVDEQGHQRVSVWICPVAGTTPTQPGTANLLATQPTWQAAANAGVAAGRSDVIVLLRGCDLLAPDALSHAAASLGSTGSTLCSGRLDQAGQPEPWLLRAQRQAHAFPVDGSLSGEGLGSPLDLTLAGTAIRRDAWQDLDPDEDWLLSTTVARLLNARGTTDVLVEPAYTWFPDHGSRAYGATPSLLPELPDRIARLEQVAALLDGGVLAERWRRTWAGFEVPRLLQDTERADDEQWRDLHDLAVSATAAERWLEGIGSAARVLLWLAAGDRRSDLEVVAAEIASLGEDLRTVRRGAAVLAEWSVADLPDEVRQLSLAETGLLARVSRIDPPGPDRRAELLLAIDHVDLADPMTRVIVQDERGQVLDCTPVAPAEATRRLGRRFQAATAVSVRVPGTRADNLHLTVSVGDLTRHGEAGVPVIKAPAAGPVRVSDLLLDGTTLVVSGSGDLGRVQILGRGDRRVDVPITVGAGEVRIELAAEAFGVMSALPPGGYRVVVGADNVAVTAGLRARLPEVQLGRQHRARFHLGPRGGLVLDLAPPLTDDEAGPYAQQRLQTAYAAADRPVDPDLFYFESYAGRTATDSPRAIFEELRRRQPAVRARWGIADASQQVPEGATPVLIRSREWYDALATAGVLVLNTDTEVWFRRRPGQFLLQTFHGYPSKAMGRTQWAAMDYPPSRIREFRTRGVDTWSAILTPTPEMTRHYREQYDYAGPAFEHGYPRDDDLTGPGAASRRSTARALLGIDDGQTAVLYAPTWRDHLASRPRAAAMTDHLDLQQAAGALGSDYVLLLRGHRFHAPERFAGSARIVDVTAYPEINDLIMAADVAVLDYSSIRFDFALTGRPMIFLVPDLDEYGAGSRQFLFPFEDSAPGPFVHDTAEVVEQLLDPGLAGRWASRIADFNSAYNPWQDGRAAERVVDSLLSG